MILFAFKYIWNKDGEEEGEEAGSLNTFPKSFWLGRLGTLQQHLLKLDVKGKNRDDKFVFPMWRLRCYETTI